MANGTGHAKARLWESSPTAWQSAESAKFVRVARKSSIKRGGIWREASQVRSGCPLIGLLSGRRHHVLALEENGRQGLLVSRVAGIATLNWRLFVLQASDDRCRNDAAVRIVRLQFGQWKAPSSANQRMAEPLATPPSMPRPACTARWQPRAARGSAAPF